MLEVQLLGDTPQLRYDGQSSHIGRRLVWVLLAYLLLHRDHPVPVAQAAAALWPDVPDDKARGNLRRYLHFLLKDLPEAPEDRPWLLRDRSTVQWNPEAPVKVDLETVEALVRRGEISADAGRLDQADEALHEAEAGSAASLLADRDEEWIVALRDRLATRLAGVKELRLRVLAAKGEHAAALELLDGLSADLENREDLAHARIWLVAQIDGREVARELLDMLGAPVERSESSIALAAALDGEEGLDAWHPGWRYLGPSEAARGAGQGPGSRIPLLGDAFIGRGPELERLKQMLAISRLVTLTGTGGAGKTRLASELCRRHASELGDEIVWTDLQGLEESTLVARELADALALEADAQRRVEVVIAEAIGERNMLIVLDNCEHVVAGVETLVPTLLQACPDLRFLATSRERIDVPGEVAWELSPLSLPEERQDVSDRIEEAEAVRLFLARVSESWPAFEASRERMMAIRRITRLVDGIPLAVELAAARVGVLPVRLLAEHLEESFGLLQRSDREHPDRHETLDRSIRWGYRLLSEAEQTMMRRLAIFNDGFTFDGASYVARVPDREGDALELVDLFDLVGRLIDTSFLRQERGRDGQRRYRLLEMIRQFGRARIEEAGEWDGLERRRGELLLSLAERAAPHLAGADASLWIQRLDDARNDILASMRWMRDAEEWNLAARFGAALWRYWHHRGHLDFEREWLHELLYEARPELEAELSASLWRGAAVLSSVTADHKRAAEMFRKGLEAAERAGDDSLTAQLHDDLGLLDLIQGDFYSARLHYAQALELRRESGDDRRAARSANLLADIAVRLGDYDEALELYEQSTAFQEATSSDTILDRYLMLQGMAQIAVYRGKLDEAQRHVDEWFEIADTLKSKGHRSGALSLQGMIHSEQGAHDRAAEAYAEALTISRELGSEHEVAAVLHLMGENDLRRGRHASAKAYLERSLEMKRESGLEWFASYTIVALARLHLETGDLDAARALVEEGGELAKRFGLKRVQEQASEVASKLAEAASDHE